MAAGLPVFTIIRKLLVFKATSELGHGNKASKNLTKLTVLIEIHLFLLNKCTSDFYKPLVNFRIIEKVDFNNFTNVINACMEWWLFRGPYSASPRCDSKVSSFFNARVGAKRRQLPAESFRKETSPC